MANDLLTTLIGALAARHAIGGLASGVAEGLRAPPLPPSGPGEDPKAISGKLDELIGVVKDCFKPQGRKSPLARGGSGGKVVDLSADDPMNAQRYADLLRGNPPQPSPAPERRRRRRRAQTAPSSESEGYGDPVMDAARERRMGIEREGRQREVRRAANREWVKAFMPQSHAEANPQPPEPTELEKLAPDFAKHRTKWGQPSRPGLLGKIGGGLARLGRSTMGGAASSVGRSLSMLGMTGAGAKMSAIGASVAAGGAGAGGGAVAAGAAGGAAAAGGGAALGGAAKAAVAALSNPITAAVAGFVAVTAVLGLAAKAVEKFAESTVESYRGLEKFNGRLAVMFAGIDRQKLVLGGRYAAATGGSAAFAGKNLMNLKEQMQPLGEAFGTIKNIVSGSLSRLAADFIKLLTTMLQPLLWITKQLEKITSEGEAQEPPMAQWFQMMGRGNLEADRARARNQRPGRVR